MICEKITDTQTYTREQIAARIVDHGDHLVIYKNKIYRLNNWIKHHPGGEMVIMHMIGRVSALSVSPMAKSA